MQYDSGSIASSRVLCERGGIKRLKGWGSNRDRQGDSLCCASSLLRVYTTPTVISTAIIPGCSAQGQERGRKRKEPSCLARYSSFSHFNVSVEFYPFVKSSLLQSKVNTARAVIWMCGAVFVPVVRLHALLRAFAFSTYLRLRIFRRCDAVPRWKCCTWLEIDR